MFVRDTTFRAQHMKSLLSNEDRPTTTLTSQQLPTMEQQLEVLSNDAEFARSHHDSEDSDDECSGPDEEEEELSQCSTMNEDVSFEEYQEPQSDKDEDDEYSSDEEESDDEDMADGDVGSEDEQDTMEKKDSIVEVTDNEADFLHDFLSIANRSSDNTGKSTLTKSGGALKPHRGSLRLKLSPSEPDENVDGDAHDDALETQSLSEAVDLLGLDDIPENTTEALRRALEADVSSTRPPSQRIMKTLLPDGTVHCMSVDENLNDRDKNKMELSKSQQPTPEDFESVQRLPMWDVADHRRTGRNAKPDTVFSWISRMVQRSKRPSGIRGMRADAA